MKYSIEIGKIVEGALKHDQTSNNPLINFQAFALITVK